MLTNEQQYFLDLIRAFIQKTSAPEADEKLDWIALYKLALKQNLTGLVHYMILQLHKQFQPPNLVKEWLKRDYLVTVAMSMTQEYELQQVWLALNTHSVVHVPMKGYVIKAYWPIPELRTMGDIDYITHEEDREKSQKVLVGLGYKIRHDDSHVWSYKKGNVYLEEHHKIDYHDIKTDKINYLEDFWNYVVPSEDFTYLLTPEYHAMFLLVHLAKHLINSGCGVRQVMDIALYFNHFHQQLDWAELWERLDSMDLSVFSKRIFSYCHFVFGITVCSTEWLDKDNDFIEKMSVTLLENGVFGDPYSIFKIEYRNNHTQHTGFKKSWNDIVSVLRFLFPKYSVLCQSSNYTYVRNHPCLLPVAYIHRAYSSVFGKEKKLKKIAALALSNYKKADEQAEVFLKMGLYLKEKDKKQ